MSYCNLVVFRNNKAENDDVEYRNAHGGASFIWNALCEKYNIRDEFGYAGISAWGALWERAKTLNLEDWERLVLLFTYDWALTQKDALCMTADSLDRFAQKYSNGKVVCHLPAIAKRMRELAADETVQAVGLYAMSCGDNMWFVWNQDTEESEPYDLSTGEKHWYTTDDVKE